MNYPTAALYTTYVSDDPLVLFSKGRLPATTRHGQSSLRPLRLHRPGPGAEARDGVTDSLIGCSDADLVLQNQTITGVQAFETCARIEAGPAFSVETGADVTFTAGTLIALEDGFVVKSGATFAAGVDPLQTPVVETRSYAVGPRPTPSSKVV